MGTFVLVHGAWQGSWVWHKVAQRLRAGGHLVLTPGLTGLGHRSHLLDARVSLSTHVTDVRNVLVYEDLHDVTLVGHSYGGMVVTGVADAEPSRIARLVYLDAIVPEDGESGWDLLPEFHPVYYEGPADHSGWQVPAPPAALFALVDERDGERVDQLSSASSMAMFVERIRLSGDHRSIARKHYVLATGWEGNPLERIAERVAKEPGWTTTRIGTGHNMMMDDPRYVADILLDSVSVD